MPRLTDSRVQTLPPGEYTDPGVKGLQIRIREARGRRVHSWLLRYKWQGEPVRIKLGDETLSLADARADALAARQLIDRGIDPRLGDRPSKRRAAPGEANGASSDPHTVAHLAHEYLERHVKRQRKRPEYVERFLDSDVLPKWGARDARTITPREVVELLDGIVERGSPTMANRGAGVLSQMFRFGVHRALVDASPVQLLYRPGGKEKPRDRALADAELGAFLANLDSVMRYQTGGTGRSPRLAHALRLLLLTGQRRGELALARWHDVTLTGKAAWCIPAEHSKTGAPHTVPLAPAAVREFQALKRYANGSAWVLPRADGQGAVDPKLLTRSVARNQKRFQAIGVQPFTAHDLRRTCRTGLAKLKVAPHIAERVLNHAQEKIPGTYDMHDYADEKRAALEQWAAHLERLK